MVLLGAIVVLAALFRTALGDALQVPTVLGDELIYEGLAKGWALHGEPILRGSLSVGNSVFYPLLLAPAFRLAADGAQALAVAKVINATAMALTTVPAYLFARRVLPRGWALGVAALSVMVPWTVYAALIMTEPLFYPVFVAFAAVLVWTLERPTALRQAVMLGSLAFLIGVRAQGLTVALGALVAILLRGAVDEGGVRVFLRRFLPTLVVFGAAAVGLAAASRVGVAVPTSSYNVVFHSLGQVGAIFKWAVWNLALFEFPLGVVALAALPVALGGMLRRGAPPLVRSSAAVTIGLGLSLLGSVALLSASPYGLHRLHERNLFYITPLLLTCVAYWLWRGMERPFWLSTASAAGCVALAWVLPQKLIETANNVDVPSAFFLLALNARIPSVSLRAWLILLAALGAGTFLIAKRPVFPIFTVVLAFAAVTAGVNYTDTLNSDQVHALAWVDHALPAGASANLVYLGGRYQACNPTAGEQEGLTVWTEWFNTHVTGVDYVETADPADGLPPPTKLVVGRGGVVLRSGKPFAPVYAIVDSRQPIVGKRLGRFDYSRLAPSERGAAALTLWRVEPPLRFKLLPRAAPGGVRGRGANLIPNGEFDAGVDGWAGNAGTERIRTEKTRRPKALTGNSMSVRVAGNRFSGVFYSPAIPIKKNASYVFSFYVKGKAGQTILPTLEWSSTGSAPPTTTDQPTGTPLTGSWQLIVFYEVPPPGAVAVTPAIVLSGTPHTSFNVDSVRLARGSASTRGLCAG